MQYHLRQATSFSMPSHSERRNARRPLNSNEKTLELKDEITKKFVAQQLAGFAKFIERVKA
jgi:hypothetical protein